MTEVSYYFFEGDQRMFSLSDKISVLSSVVPSQISIVSQRLVVKVIDTVKTDMIDDSQVLQVTWKSTLWSSAVDLLTSLNLKSSLCSLAG